MQHTIALFGEAVKGEFRIAYYCKTLHHLSEHLGEPPNSHSKGLDFAVQALLLQRDVLYFRVHEEGFSTEDYLSGFSFLENKDLVPRIAAICLPGVGNSEIIQATDPIRNLYHSILILTETDLYDYLTCRPLR
jgi:hypothetical protein